MMWSGNEQKSSKMAGLLRSIARPIYRGMPSAARGWIDATIRPSKQLGIFGGPFNGQTQRRMFVERVLRSGMISRIIETGCFRGDTTVFFAEHFQGRVVAIESSVEFASFTKKRLRAFKNVQVITGDSGIVLKNFCDVGTDANKAILFYLDAHWNEKLPIRSELLAIRNSGAPSVVLIDDFKVPGDAGYAFDDYGAAGCLTLDFIHDILEGVFEVFFPLVASKNETGFRRGLCVLANTTVLCQQLRIDPYLRVYPLQ